MSVATKIKLKSFESLLGDDEAKGSVKEIDISQLHEFQNHPFKVIDDEKMDDMAKSIQEYGVLTPILVRQLNDGYEIISGHRRKYACEKIGLKTIPAIIKEFSDDEAVITMVDSNLQREEILPSEKAFSYRMKLDAIKRQGKRTDLTCTQFGYKSENKKSVEILAEETGESRNQIQRYIRLTYLSDKILDGIFDGVNLIDLVDEKKLPLNAAVELSYLSEEEQNTLIAAMEISETVPSLAQALRIKEYSKERELTEDICFLILTEEKATSKNISLKSKILNKYFPKDYTSEQMETVILSLLEKWSEENGVK